MKLSEMIRLPTLRDFEPDLLLGAFASGLAGKGLRPFLVKEILESEKFFELGKLRIAEYSRVSRHAYWRVVAFLKEAQADGAELDAYENLLSTDLLKLDVCELNAFVIYARKCVKHSKRKPAHRPSSGKNGERFRTAAVAAAHYFRATGANPKESWEWVADRLKGERVLRPKESRFTAKTIQNWSSKVMYNCDLRNGMDVLANSPLGVGRRALVAESAITSAIHFGRITENS